MNLFILLIYSSGSVRLLVTYVELWESFHQTTISERSIVYLKLSETWEIFQAICFDQ